MSFTLLSYNKRTIDTPALVTQGGEKKDNLQGIKIVIPATDSQPDTAFNRVSGGTQIIVEDSVQSVSPQR